MQGPSRTRSNWLTASCKSDQDLTTTWNYSIKTKLQGKKHWRRIAKWRRNCNFWGSRIQKIHNAKQTHQWSNSKTYSMRCLSIVMNHVFKHLKLISKREAVQGMTRFIQSLFSMQIQGSTLINSLLQWVVMGPILCSSNSLGMEGLITRKILNLSTTLTGMTHKCLIRLITEITSTKMREGVQQSSNYARSIPSHLKSEMRDKHKLTSRMKTCARVYHILPKKL